MCVKMVILTIKLTSSAPRRKQACCMLRMLPSLWHLRTLQASKGRPSMVRLLLKAGAAVDAQDRLGEVPDAIK